MSLKFKSIIAAAVLSVSAVSSAAVVNASTARSEKEAAYDAAVELRDSPEWIDAFQEALLEGKSPTDPVHAAIFSTDISGFDEVSPAYLEQTAPASTDVRLTLIHDDSGSNSYNLWSGRFVVDNVSDFAATFTEPYTMDCKLFVGTTGRLDYQNDFSVNYKKLMGQYYYMEDGRKVGSHDTSEGVGTISDVSSTYSGSGKLIEKAYYYYMHKGGAKSEYYDVAVIHVVDKDYAQTAEYAALPYGNLIDCYTYVDTSELSAAVPEEN